MSIHAIIWFMNNAEIEMINLLSELKNTCHATGVKAEFEAEGSTFEEALLLKELASRAGLSSTIKIGGCEAVNDINQAISIDADSLVAPMIESSFAFEKFMKCFDSIENNNIKKYINIETISGFNCFDEILESRYIKNLNGVVFGRTDMCGSMGWDFSKTDSAQMLDYANVISQKCYQNGLEFLVGGNISTESVEFLSEIKYLKGFETRKIIFDSSIIQNSIQINAIAKAIEFELLWLKNKKKSNGAHKTRIENLKKRITKNPLLSY